MSRSAVPPGLEIRVVPWDPSDESLGYCRAVPPGRNGTLRWNQVCRAAIVRALRLNCEAMGQSKIDPHTDPVVEEVRAIRAKLWKEAGGTFEGLRRLLDDRVGKKRGRSSANGSRGRGTSRKRK